MFGTLIASMVGTTGAAMILIRPLMRANPARHNNVHVVVFFIFLVANIGGALSPLGDPPLFVGFLRGVDFFWTTTHICLRDRHRRRAGAGHLFRHRRSFLAQVAARRWSGRGPAAPSRCALARSYQPAADRL